METKLKRKHRKDIMHLVRTMFIVKLIAVISGLLIWVLIYGFQSSLGFL